ncbi:flagellar biosynthetic protein FliQ [Desulfocapsa sulfexigens DSM 10523]|uniref:Flagellar biosynthetic protein FliQ n=1 Tax=Desulfocapsa sulfexigens (strain DSM 10523 / SB164P1) TaxID=1167006 RepID=M1P817_DESSD|nr:flagellar biosynthesis protein FliQ [Desulfocapsa sulfexigens]AGF79618.1 flagellar biosynthetic protein FliQ [Desulfocapsa sulfexigens DSM 10523]
MTDEFVVDICRKAIQTALMISGPMLLAGMIIGLIVSIFQATTQINEQTLTFIPKIIAVFITLLLMTPWMIHTMTSFATAIFTTIATF